MTRPHIEIDQREDETKVCVENKGKYKYCEGDEVIGRGHDLRIWMGRIIEIDQEKWMAKVHWIKDKFGSNFITKNYRTYVSIKSLFMTSGCLDLASKGNLDLARASRVKYCIGSRVKSNHKIYRKSAGGEVVGLSHVNNLRRSYICVRWYDMLWYNQRKHSIIHCLNTLTSCKKENQITPVKWTPFQD